jgi:hypothetical protein
MLFLFSCRQVALLRETQFTLHHTHPITRLCWGYQSLPCGFKWVSFYIYVLLRVKIWWALLLSTILSWLFYAIYSMLAVYCMITEPYYCIYVTFSITLSALNWIFQSKLTTSSKVPPSSPAVAALGPEIIFNNLKPQLTCRPLLVIDKTELTSKGPEIEGFRFLATWFRSDFLVRDHQSPLTCQQQQAINANTRQIRPVAVRNRSSSSPYFKNKSKWKATRRSPFYLLPSSRGSSLLSSNKLRANSDTQRGRRPWLGPIYTTCEHQDVKSVIKHPGLHSKRPSADDHGYTPLHITVRNPNPQAVEAFAKCTKTHKDTDNFLVTVWRTQI